MVVEVRRHFRRRERSQTLEVTTSVARVVGRLLDSRIDGGRTRLQKEVSAGELPSQSTVPRVRGRGGDNLEAVVYVKE